MIVVSDTSPLAYLVAIGVGDVLHQLYGEVFVPPSVAGELSHPKCPAVAWMAAQPPWLRIQAPQSAPPADDLDLGEREAIALAMELSASRLLIDEARGRQAAKSLGLKTTGTLAVIVDAAQQGLIDGAAAIDRLTNTSFYASDELLQFVRQKLRQADA